MKKNAQKLDSIKSVPFEPSPALKAVLTLKEELNKMSELTLMIPKSRLDV